MDALILLFLRLSEMLFRPEVFKIFLGSMAGLSLALVVAYLILSKKQAKLIETDKNNLAQSWAGQVKTYESRDNELSRTIESLKAQLDSHVKEMEALRKEKEEDLRKKDEDLKRSEGILRGEIAAKEKISKELQEAQSQLLEVNSQLELSEKEVSFVGKLKQDIEEKEGTLKNEITEKEKLLDNLKNAQDALSGLTQEVRASREMYHGLKEQYEDLERQVDALHQSLALEKTLHQRLKDEHSKCVRPVSA